MTSKPRLSSRPPHAEENAAVLPALAWLQAELAETYSPNERALLAHEAGVIEEEYRDSAEALALYQMAIDADAEFGEPLERLIAFAERTRNRSDLAKLLDRLADVATSAEERGRASVERAVSELLDLGNLTQARDLLLEASETLPADVTAWTLLDLLGERLQDSALRERALRTRILLTEHPQWRGLLQMDLAELKWKEGFVPEALDHLETIITEGGPASYPALLLLERIGTDAKRPEILAQALSRQATWIERARSESPLGDALGIPLSHRDSAHLAHVYLRSSLVCERLGDKSGRALGISRAAALLPTDRVVLGAALAEASQDCQWDHVVEAGEQLAALVDGRSRAAYLLQVAEAEICRGDGAKALAAVQRGIQADPNSLPLKALELHLLADGHNPSALATVLRATLSNFSSPSAQSRWLLVVAEILANECHDTVGAKAAIEQALEGADDPSAVHRVARFLASTVGDVAWQEETTGKLLESLDAPIDAEELWLDLIRLRLDQREPPGVLSAVSGLRKTPGGDELGALLEVLLVPAMASRSGADDGDTSRWDPTDLAAVGSRRAELLGHLGELALSPAGARSFGLLAALDELNSRNLSAAFTRIREQSERYPADLVLSSARVALGIVQGAHTDVVEALETAAVHQPDETLKTEFALQGALLAFAYAMVPAARTLLELAEPISPEAVAAIQRWQLRRFASTDPAIRREVLEAGRALSHPHRTILERAALELSLGNAEAADSLLEGVETSGSALGGAISLLRTLRKRQAGQGEPDLAPLLAQTPDLARAEAALSYQQALTETDILQDRPKRLAMAASWAEVDPSATAQLEWVAAARAAGRLDEEILAREALALRLPGESGELLAISASLLRWLGGSDDQPLLVDIHPAARLANWEMSPPGCDPRRRATALAELGDLGGQGWENTTTTLEGYNWLVAGEPEKAISAFTRVVESDGEDAVAWEGLALAAEIAGNLPLLADAYGKLGELLPASRGSEYWERAATLWFDHLGEETKGEEALCRSVAKDVRRTTAFARLFRRIRDRKDPRPLLDLIDRRLPFSDDNAELITLHWERARSLRSLGDREGALAALVAVTDRVPDHLGALALAGEIYIGLGQHDKAASSLAKLAASDQAPPRQRLMSGIAAVDLYELKLDDLESALSVLLVLHRSGHGTVVVRERLARVASRLGRWGLATELLELLMVERPTSEGRAEAAQLCLRIHRDSRLSPADALAATTRLLAESPTCADGIELVLSGCFDGDISRRLLVSSQIALSEHLTRHPLSSDDLERLARIAARLKDAPLRQACLGALMGIGKGSRSIEEELAHLDERVAKIPTIAIDTDTLAELSDPEDDGPIASMFRNLALVYAEALGPTLSRFGVGRRQRVDPRSGIRVRSEIASWAGALGIGDFDLYVTETLPRPVIGIPGERPAVIIAANVEAPLRPNERHAVATELLALRRGTTLLLDRERADGCALVVASCKLAGITLSSPPYAMVDEFQRLVSSALPRRAQPTLLAHAQAIADAGVDPAQWVVAALATLDRMGTIAAGDVSYVLATVNGQRGRVLGTLEAENRTRRLLSFVMSPHYLELRQKLGLSVR